MKLILLFLTISYLQCVYSANLFSSLTNVLSGTLSKVTKTTDSITKPVLDTASGVLNTGTHALGSVGSLVGGTLGSVGKVTGSLAQVLGDVTDGLVNAAGALLEGVFGLTQEVLDSLKFYKKEDIPLNINRLSDNVFQCFARILRKFQNSFPQSVRITSNMYEIAEYFGNFQNHCWTRSSESEIADCIDVVRISGGLQLNSFNIDLVPINVQKAAELGAVLKNDFVTCYTL